MSRATRTPVACDTCRKRKIRCNGARPKCEGCNKSSAECQYQYNMTPSGDLSDLKRKYDNLENAAYGSQEVLRLMHSEDAETASLIFSKIRQGIDCDTIWRSVNGGGFSREVSPMPQREYQYVFPFDKRMPALIESIYNPYLHSPMLTCLTEPSQGSPGASSTPMTQVQPPGPYSRPYHSAEIIDFSLGSAEPAKWTNVRLGNDLMRKLLRAYFLHDYEWTPFFQKDYFFEGMVAGKHAFCSELLVNSVLALACYCERDLESSLEYWNPKSLSYQFLAEAKRLWEIEGASGRSFLTTIQAGPIINIVYTFMGLDELGWRYTEHAISLAQETGLFNKPTEKHLPKVQRARDFTAWALFSWQSHYSYHIQQPPLLKKAPASPLPDPALFITWYGDISINYCPGPSHISTKFSNFFKTRTEFLILLNEVNIQLSQEQGPNTLQLYLLYLRLQGWFEKLPEFLIATQIFLPAHLKLHMHYYYVVMEIFKLEAKKSPSSPSHDFFCEGVTVEKAKDIYMNATICFETLLRVYFLRHGFETLDGFLAAYLAYWSFEMLGQLYEKTDDSNTESIRSTLFLCAKGLHEQGRIHFLGNTLFRVLYRSMTLDDQNLFNSHVHCIAKADEEYGRGNHICSRWVIKTVAEGNHLKGQTLNELMEKLYRSGG